MSAFNSQAAFTDQCVYSTAAGGSGFTLTLPAAANAQHAITCIQLYRSATAALAGTASLTVTTTNLPGSPSWVVGNVMAAGGTQIDIDTVFSPPLVSSVAGTATTFVVPAPGAAVLWNMRVFYYLAQSL